MNQRDSARRAASQQQLLFDWSSSENVPAAQPATPAPDAESPVPPPSPVAPFPVPNETGAGPQPEEAERARGYSPGHPWYYYLEGDNAAPLPFDDIPPCQDYDRSIERELPKPAFKRIVKARELLQTERLDLVHARARYEDVIARGAKALSRYDREIAYGGDDEMARAGTLALLFNQISWRLGRIAFLERESSRQSTRGR